MILCFRRSVARDVFRGIFLGSLKRWGAGNPDLFLILTGGGIFCAWMLAGSRVSLASSMMIVHGAVGRSSLVVDQGCVSPLVEVSKISGASRCSVPGVAVVASEMIDVSAPW